MAVRTYSQLVSSLNDACEIALKNVSEIVRDKLEEFITEDFYNMYKPLIYERSYMFMKSPKYNMLSKSSATVFIDTDVMHYLGISGEDVANLASYGFHGSTDIFRSGFYWTDFIAWADENVPRLLKAELRKQGVPVK